LSIHWKQPIILDKAALFDKVIHANRGGFCYELNGLFGWLLGELGFQVTLLSASVYSESDESYGQPFDHLMLRVDLAQSYLVDVGFGEGYLEPLLLQEDMEQRQGQKAFKLSRVDEQWTYFEQRADAQSADSWRARYRFTLVPRAFSDFREMCHYQQTSPQSHFTQKVICTLATPEGRVTLSDDRFIITENGVRTEQTVDEGDQTHLLQKYFQIRFC